MWISVEKEILISDKILGIFSNVLNLDVGYIDNFKYYGNKNNEYHIEISRNDKGFLTHLMLSYKSYLENDLYHEKKMELKKVEVLKAIAKEYNTKTATSFHFRSDILHPEYFISNTYAPETFMFNSDGELFHIYDVSENNDYLIENGYTTEEELENITIGVIHLEQTKIDEKELIYEINRYYDNQIKNMINERKSKDIVIYPNEVPDVDKLPQYEYELLLKFKTHKQNPIYYGKYKVLSKALSDESLSKIMGLVIKANFIQIVISEKNTIQERLHIYNKLLNKIVKNENVSKKNLLEKLIKNRTIKDLSTECISEYFKSIKINEDKNIFSYLSDEYYLNNFSNKPNECNILFIFDKTKNTILREINGYLQEINIENNKIIQELVKYYIHEFENNTKTCIVMTIKNARSNNNLIENKCIVKLTREQYNLLYDFKTFGLYAYKNIDNRYELISSDIYKVEKIAKFIGFI